MNLEHTYDGSSDTLLHSAIKDGNARKVKELIKLGSSIIKKTVLEEGINTITNVTPINSAIYYRNPEVLVALLCSEKNAYTLDIKCKDINGAYLSSIDLALKVAKEMHEEDHNSKLVWSIIFLIFLFRLVYEF